MRPEVTVGLFHRGPDNSKSVNGSLPSLACRTKASRPTTGRRRCLGQSQLREIDDVLAHLAGNRLRRDPGNFVHSIRSQTNVCKSSRLLSLLARCGLYLSQSSFAEDHRHPLTLSLHEGILQAISWPVVSINTWI